MKARFFENRSNVKRSFFVIDLLLCCVWTLFVLHLWSAHFMTSWLIADDVPFQTWAAPIVLYALLLRLGMSFMMYKDDRNGIWVSLILLSIGLVMAVLPAELMDDAFYDIFYYSDMVDSGLSSSLLGYLAGIFGISDSIRILMILWVIPISIWIWIVPLLYSLIRIRKRTTTSVSLPFALTGLYLFKDNLGKEYLKISIFIFLSLAFGFVMNSMVSLIGLLLLSVALYLYMERSERKRMNNISWILMLLAAIGFWTAQYLFGWKRLSLLAVSMMLSAVVIYLLFRGSGKMLKPLALAFLSCLLIPSFCLGYDVFNLTDCVRMENLKTDYNLTGLIKIRNDKGKVGLRDRYRLIIPTAYSDIADYHLPYLKVKKVGLWGVWNTQYAGRIKGDWDYIIVGPGRKYASFEDLSFVQKPIYTSLKGIKDNYSYFEFQKGPAKGLAVLEENAKPYVFDANDQIVSIHVYGSYIDITANDSMHYVLDEKLHPVYGDGVAYAKIEKPSIYALYYKKGETGLKYLRMLPPTSNKGYIFMDDLSYYSISETNCRDSIKHMI